VELPMLDILIGPEAPDVERFAATELQRYMRMLFGRDPTVADGPAPAGTPLALVGSPATNPAIAALGLEPKWPAVTDQGVVVKSVAAGGRPVWMVGGGSPAATLWAVYELVEQMGVTFLLSGDVFPDAPGLLALPDIDVVREPVFRDRIWRAWGDEPHTSSMWSLDEHLRVVDQLAKSKINLLLLNSSPSDPFIHYEFRGVKRRTATINYGLKFPVDAHTIGREHFGDVAEFTNPEFRHCRTYEETIETGQRFARTLFAHARSRGMKVGIIFNLSDVSQEFKDRFHEWSPPEDGSRGEQGKTDFAKLGELTVGTPPQNRSFQDVNNPALFELTELIVRSHLETYPEVELVLAGPGEFRSSVAGHESCWEYLDQKYGIEQIAPLEDLIQSARARPYHTEGRAERELKADIEFLYFYDRLFNENKLLERLGRTDVRFVLPELTEELYPVLGRVLRPGFGTTTLIDYNLSLALPRIDALDGLRDAPIDSYFIMSLQDDMQSLLVSAEGGRMEKFLAAMRRNGFTGWFPRYYSLGDLDHTALYLYRSGWDTDLTADAAYADYVGRVFGEACLPEMREVLQLLEANSFIQDTDLFAVGFPYPNVMRWHFDRTRIFGSMEAPREQLLRCRDTYVRVRSLLRAARDKVRPEGRGNLDYMIGRMTMCALFLETAFTVEQAGFAYRASRQARDDYDPEALKLHLDEAARLLERAVGLARDTALAQAANVRNESDVGLLAMMNQYMHRWLQARSFLVSHEATQWHL
jgi:hypothetical protein